MIDIKSGELLDLLKQTAFAENIEVQSISFALKDEIGKILDVAGTTMTQAGVDHLPEKILDVLAVENNTPYYRQDMDVETKRGIVKGTFKWNMRGGTVGAMQELVSVVFGKSEVVEWFNYDSWQDEDRGTFYIKVEVIVTEEMIDFFLQTLDQIKNTRSHLKRIISELVASLDDPDPTSGRTPFIHEGIEIIYAVKYHGEFENKEDFASNSVQFLSKVNFWGATTRNGVCLHDGQIRHGEFGRYRLKPKISLGAAVENSMDAASNEVGFIFGVAYTEDLAVPKLKLCVKISEPENIEADFATKASFENESDLGGKVIIRTTNVYRHDGDRSHNGSFNHRNIYKEEIL